MRSFSNVSSCLGGFGKSTFSTFGERLVSRKTFVLKIRPATFPSWSGEQRPQKTWKQIFRVCWLALFAQKWRRLAGPSMTAPTLLPVS